MFNNDCCRCRRECVRCRAVDRDDCCCNRQHDCCEKRCDCCCKKQYDCCERRCGCCQKRGNCCCNALYAYGAYCALRGMTGGNS